MAVLSWRKEETVGHIILDNGENRHNPPFQYALLEALDEIEADDALKAVVISSADEKCWSLGIDLNWVMMNAASDKTKPKVRDFLNRNNEIFTRLLTYPMPVIAAMNGHAFGNGAIMSCAMDFRFMRSDKGFFCFPEVDVSIPFLPVMQSIIERAVPAYKLTELALTGRRIGGQEAAEHHIALRAVEGGEATVAEALAFAKTFDKGRIIFKEMKTRISRHILKLMETEDPAYIEPLNIVV